MQAHACDGRAALALDEGKIVGSDAIAESHDPPSGARRGVHGELVRIQGRAPDRLRFELGLRRGARPLATYLSGDRVA